MTFFAFMCYTRRWDSGNSCLNIFFIYLDFLKPGKQKNRLFFLLGNLKQYKNHSKADLKPLPDAGHWASGP